MKNVFKCFNKRYFPNGLFAFLLYNTVYEKFLSPLVIDYLEFLGATIVQQRVIDVLLFILGFCLYQIIVTDGKEHIADIKKAIIALKNLILRISKKLKNGIIKVLVYTCRKIGRKFNEISESLEKNID